MTRRAWSDEEHIVAIYLYRFGFEELGFTYPEIARMLGRKPSSIIMRYANYLNIEDGGSGLSGGGVRAREMYNAYRAVPKQELRRKVLNILQDMAER